MKKYMLNACTLIVLAASIAGAVLIIIVSTQARSVLPAGSSPYFTQTEMDFNFPERNLRDLWLDKLVYNEETLFISALGMGKNFYIQPVKFQIKNFFEIKDPNFLDLNEFLPGFNQAENQLEYIKSHPVSIQEIVSVFTPTLSGWLGYYQAKLAYKIYGLSDKKCSYLGQYFSLGPHIGPLFFKCEKSVLLYTFEMVAAHNKIYLNLKHIKIRINK